MEAKELMITWDKEIRKIKKKNNKKNLQGLQGQGYESSCALW